MYSLYSDIEPFNHFHLPVEFSAKKTQNHTLYVEQCGNPRGIPVVFLHGGPGSGCKEQHRCYFDPKIYHIILFDQRGCGRSKPLGKLLANSTMDLVNDIDLIREKLHIKSWLVFGGSWGATLGLLYSQAHKDRVLGLILRGVFLAREQDIDWVYGDNGAARLFPDVWSKLIEDLPLTNKAKLLAVIYQQLTSTDDEQSTNMFNKLQQWESTIVTVGQDETKRTVVNEKPNSFISMEQKTASIIQLYYSLNLCFIDQSPILENINVIQNIPTTIIHGRYDTVCPIEQSWLLSKKLPQAEFKIIPLAGHAANEPAIIDALIAATISFSQGYLKTKKYN